MTDTNSNENRPNVRIRIDDERRFGHYANFVTGTFTPQDLTLDFGQFMTGQEGEINVDVISRIKIAPSVAPRLIQTLTALIEGYNETYVIPAQQFANEMNAGE